jgi:hypothetical protein
MILIFTIWQQHYRSPLRWINDEFFVGFYGHVGFGFHVLIGRDRPFKGA